MFLLSSKKILLNILLIIFIIISQAYSPKVMLYEGVNLSLDIFLVFLTFLVLLNKTIYIIFVAFLFGLLQDFIIHHETMGLFSFIKSLSIFYLDKVKKNNNLWIRYFKIIYILFIYCIHFIIYYSIVAYDINLFILIISFSHAIITFILFILIEKILFNSKLL